MQKFRKTTEDHIKNQAVESCLATINEEITDGEVASEAYVAEYEKIAKYVDAVIQLEMNTISRRNTCYARSPALLDTVSTVRY